jgi:hypothetical protein
LVPLFASGVIDTGGKFAAGVIDTGGKLPLVSLSPAAKLVAKFAAGVVDTSGKLPPVSLISAAILPPVSLTQVANLPLVSLIPVMPLDLQISPRIFEKIRKGPNGILWGWGETDSWKKPEAKNS